MVFMFMPADPGDAKKTPENKDLSLSDVVKLVHISDPKIVSVKKHVKGKKHAKKHAKKHVKKHTKKHAKKHAKKHNKGKKIPLSKKIKITLAN